MRVFEKADARKNKKEEQKKRRNERIAENSNDTDKA
jgi:hypothetical protein